MVALRVFWCGDCPGLRFAGNEASRLMATPRAGDMEKVTRVAQYLKGGRRRKVFGRDDGGICVFSDSDLAWCLTTRKSATGITAHRPVHNLTLVGDA